MLNNFRFATYRFTLAALDALELPPYKGSTLRGGFGHVFKRTVCFQKDVQTCDTCLLKNNCPYGYLFETSPPADTEVLRTLSDVPLPFVIEPPLDNRTNYQPGDLLEFGLILVGRAINYLPYFVVVFRELGRMGIGQGRGKYVLQRIAAVQPLDRVEALVYNGMDVVVRDQDLSVGYAEVETRARGLPGDRVTIRFLTPTRLKHQGQYVRRPDFHVLIRAILRRVSSLSYFHCGQLWDADFRGIIAAAEAVEATRLAVEWVDWERYSGRQKQRMNLGGFVGEVTYQGDLGPFRPLLALGELVHVGKACVFGNGRYELER
jgi:hypothetical protein